jgi:hypothetical protein
MRYRLGDAVAVGPALSLQHERLVQWIDGQRPAAAAGPRRSPWLPGVTAGHPRDLLEPRREDASIAWRLRSPRPDVERALALDRAGRDADDALERASD